MQRGRDGATHSWAARGRRRERTGRTACCEAPAAARGVDARPWSSMLCGRARRRGLGHEPACVGPKAVAGVCLPASQGTAESRSARDEAGRVRAPLRAGVPRRRPVRRSSRRRGQGNGARESLARALATRSRARALARVGLCRCDVRGLRPSRGGRLEELRLAALEARLEALAQLGRNDEVLGEALAMAREHPLRERVQGVAMLALYRAGRQTEALDHYSGAATPPG